MKEELVGYPVGASLIAITVFYLLAFASNSILESTTLVTLGITVTLSVLVFLSIVIMILFAL